MTTTPSNLTPSPRDAYDDEHFDADLAAEIIASCLERGDSATLTNWFAEGLAVDIADALDRLQPAQLAAALLLIPVDEQASIFGYLPLGRQTQLVAGMSRAAVISLLERMSSDERADLFNTLPAGREAILPALAQAQREDIRKLASYEKGSVGAIMNSQYATLTPELTVAEAIDELRRVAPDSETIYNAYVIDEQRRLVGVTTLRRLILMPATTRVGEMMKSNPVTAFVDDEQSLAAEKIARYDFIALPVIDRQRQMVGIVTADDAMDVMEDEVTEDFQKSGGSLGAWPLRMKDATIGLLYRKRVFWLVLLVFANIFSGAGIAHFEELIAANVALVFFLPLLIDSGGNAGSQSATLMVRALATGDVHMRDWASMLGRELLVAALLGLTMAIAVSALGVVRAGPTIALVVALTMQIVVIVGSLIGMSLPFLLSHFKADPAAASSPLITTIADASGIFIYFAIASQVLPGLASA
ncbi:MAG TPA: magnesium transporter [Dokdonella sp.]|uniref:magnesium transporter n=1 Tax=Dokdonella sp. TaxID=2291710 RepID=UPI002D7F6895|nr:magnesium transporter [Dokdonella sp.]HET9032803.1 magnesium transporter [Dokdonella sp.]